MEHYHNRVRELQQNHSYRMGQAYWVASAELYPAFASSIAGNRHCDPYHNDKAVGNFLVVLIEYVNNL